MNSLTQNLVTRPPRRPFLALLGLVSLVAFAMALATTGAGRASAQTPEPTASEPLLNVFQDHVRQFDNWLRIAEGQAVPCGTPCVRDDDPRRILEQLTRQCGKIGLREATAFPEYRGQTKVAIDQLIAACSVLETAQDEYATATEARLRAIAAEARSHLTASGGTGSSDTSASNVESPTPLAQTPAPPSTGAGDRATGDPGSGRTPTSWWLALGVAAALALGTAGWAATRQR